MIKKRDKEKPTFECIEMDDIKRLNQTEEKENSEDDKISLDDLSVCSPSKLHRKFPLTDDEEEEQEKLIHSKLYESMNNVNSTSPKRDTHWFDRVDNNDDDDDDDIDEKRMSAHFVDAFPNSLLISGDRQAAPEHFQDDESHNNRGDDTPRNSNYNNNPTGNLRGNPVNNVHGNLQPNDNDRKEQPPPSNYLNCSGKSEKNENPWDYTYKNGENPLCHEKGKDKPSEITVGGHTQRDKNTRKNELEKWRKYASSDEEREKTQTGQKSHNVTNERLEKIGGGDMKERVYHSNGHSDDSDSHMGVPISAMPRTPLKEEVADRINPQHSEDNNYAKWEKRTSRQSGGSPTVKTNKQYGEGGLFYAMPLVHSSKENSDDEGNSPLRKLSLDGWATSRVRNSNKEKEKKCHEGVTNRMTRIISRIEESVQEKKTQKGGKYNRGRDMQGNSGGSDCDDSDDEHDDDKQHGRHDAWGAESEKRTDAVSPLSNNSANPALPSIQVTLTDKQKIRGDPTLKYPLKKYGSESYSNVVGYQPRGETHNDMDVPLGKKSLSSSHFSYRNMDEEVDRHMQIYGRLDRPNHPNKRGSAPEGKREERNDSHSNQTHRHAYRVGINSVKMAEKNVEDGGMSDDLPSRPKPNSTEPIKDTTTEKYKLNSPTNISRVSPNRIHREMEEHRPFVDDTHFQMNPIKINDAKLEKCFHAINDLCNVEDGKRKNRSGGDRNISLCSEYLDRPSGIRDCEERRRWSESPVRKDHPSWRHIGRGDAPVQNVCKSSDVNLYENNFQCLSQISPDEHPSPDVYQFFYKENELWDKTRGQRAHTKEPSNHTKEPSHHTKEPSDHSKEPSRHPKEPSDHPLKRQDEGKGDASSTRAADGPVPGAVPPVGGEEAPGGAGGKVKRRIIDCKNERLKWGTTQVIIDIDDTIRSSGGYKFFNYALGGVDAQYQRGETYPGSFQFIFELAMNKLSSEAKPLLLSVLTARIPQVPITEDSFLNKKFNEVAERRGIKSWGIDCENKILYSTLKEWVWNETRGEKKFVNFKHLHKYVLQQNSLVRYIWIGDTGDMDKQAGEMMIRTYPQRMKAVFLHHVKGKDDNTLLPSDYFIKSVPIFFFRTYIGAATKAHAYNLIDKKGLTRVLVQAVLDLEKSKAPASSSKWEDLIKDIILSDAMDELDKYNAETVNRTKKIIAQRMREISERKLHFIS
ncbi:hypothetical protein, conserved in Apicomplexan species [Plasmodium knowlesi strain H]|uniref:Uncharacterized protein n=3 Tax=Plasmodium knowlesi TaxID=5850 RepID=A0A5K1UU39_PLAKH|nr:uncharacterized protein PKNH_1025800 [Plasmodium knowlesi strain H]OTN67224.1 Uncharacterized protein PKNOH_S07463800 [Plasmodium knowlesi]CAA9988762.1 conserved protein, unknown function [Plasmodium knowlesi strain H]SBO21711.1 hypothetical protein, conserved in Apicomplexan species [Plasmodium knowlesi strain H]SBO22097.1 hypothetical protein, conserved in Apicomplexan species [Plasmodium knowlesi strain H]VVS78236.1 conserved protein, unknown function [Plasmodium knowlesi strain H]|eukprot:XP_002259738.1 [Plasmodium knowlesi strain H]